MSKSYKYPIFKDTGKTGLFYKKLSNRKIRKYLRSLSIGFKSSKLFKQLINSYDICDWKNFPEDKLQKIKAKRK